MRQPTQFSLSLHPCVVSPAIPPSTLPNLTFKVRRRVNGPDDGPNPHIWECADLAKWVESLVTEGGACFGVVVVQKNGMLHTNREVCTLEITPQSLALRLPNTLTIQQPYSAAMQVSTCLLYPFTWKGKERKQRGGGGGEIR
jgi:hypothetical protein